MARPRRKKGRPLVTGQTNSHQDEIPRNVAGKGLGKEEGRGVRIPADQGQSQGKPEDVGRFFWHPVTTL